MTVASGFGLQLCAWDGQPTCHVPLCRLDTDEHGTWYRWSAGAPATGSDGSVRRHTEDFLVLMPHHGTWLARWGDDGVMDRHAKVTTATAITEHGISAVDLDLDVVRFSTGRVAVVDQDPFDRRRVELAYPPDLVRAALHATRSLYRALSRGDEPFDVAGADRLRALRRAVAVAG